MVLQHFLADPRGMYLIIPTMKVDKAGPLAWPSCLSDLSPVDFIHGDTKNLVYLVPIENGETYH